MRVGRHVGLAVAFCGGLAAGPSAAGTRRAPGYELPLCVDSLPKPAAENDLWHAHGLLIRQPAASRSVSPTSRGPANALAAGLTSAKSQRS